MSLTADKPSSGLVATPHRWLRWVLGIALSLLLVALLLANVDILTMLQMLMSVDSEWLLFAFLLLLANKIARAIRFLVLTESPSGELLQMTAVVSALSLANYIMPARTGELSYLYLVRKSQGIGIGTGLTSLLIARLLDLLAIAWLFILMSGIWLGQLPIRAQGYLLLAIFIMTAISIAVVILIILRGQLRKLGIRFLESRWLDWLPWRSRMIKLMGEVERGLDTVRSVKQLGELTVLSVLAWLCMFGLNHTLLLALDVHVAFWQTVVGSTFGALSSMLPISTVGSLGTLEAGWTGGFLLVGMDAQTAIASGFAVHILSFAYTMIFGLIGLILIYAQGIKERFQGARGKQTEEAGGLP